MAAKRKTKRRRRTLSSSEVRQFFSSLPGPKRKFKVGDLVVDRNGSRGGVVSYVGEYDSLIGGYRYKVLEPSGLRHYWNETSMVKVSR